MLFTTLCTGWILKARTRKIVFAQTCQTSENWEQIPISPPLTPLEGPYLPLEGPGGV